MAVLLEIIPKRRSSSKAGPDNNMERLAAELLNTVRKVITMFTLCVHDCPRSWQQQP
jgi:hypothetical protein